MAINTPRYDVDQHYMQEYMAWRIMVETKANRIFTMWSEKELSSVELAIAGRLMWDHMTITDQLTRGKSDA